MTRAKDVGDKKSAADGTKSVVDFYKIGQYLKKPRPPTCVIESVLPDNALSALIGPTGTLKTAGGCGMAVSTATGSDWFGHAIRQGPTFILAGEGRNGVARRLAAARIDRKLSFKGVPLYLSSRGVGLSDRKVAQALSEKIDSVAQKCQQPPRLIVIDTLARNFGPGDENNASDMGVFIENIDRRLRERFRCAVLIVHHTGHGNTGRARGSSAFRGALDAEMVFSREDDSVILTCTKMKDMPEFEPIHLRIASVELPWKGQGGKPDTSVVLKLDTSPPTAKASKQAPKQGTAVKMLRKMVKEQDEDFDSVPVSAWRDHLIEAEVISGQKAFDKLKKRLLEKNLIEVNGGRVTFV